MPEENALDEFAKDFPTAEEIQKQDDFLTPKSEAAPEEDGAAQEEGEDGHKNRRHRRIEAKLQAEREANIHLNARLEALSEAAQFAKETGGLTVDERLIRLYGDDENGRKAAQLTQSLLEDTAKRARAEALDEMREQERRESREVAENESLIDENLEALEDEHGIDLTSNSPQGRKNRTEYLNMVERLSSKDEDGNIQEYADFNEVFDVYQRTRSKPDSSRQKDYASRGQVHSGGSATKAADTAGENYLRQHGII